MAQDLVIVVQIPQVYEDAGLLREYALKWRELRLQALQTDPTAYASTYESESKFPIEAFEARLNNSFARSFIALQPAEGDGQASEDHALSGTWLGLLGLLGPMPFNGEHPSTKESPWKLFQKRSPNDPTPGAVAKEDTENLDVSTQTFAYFLVSMYVSPKLRGRGLGQQLINAALFLTKEEVKVKGAKGGVCTVTVEADNEAAKALYSKSGFELRGRDDFTGSGGENVEALILSQNIG